MNKHIKSQLLAVGSILGTTTLAGISLVLSNIVNADIIDTINLTIPSACNINATGSTSGNIVHEVTIAPGQLRNAESETDPISKSRITATCNDANGYSIYAIGFSNDIEGTTDMIAGDPLTSESNIATGNATTGNISNWGMKVIASTGTDAPTINTTDENLRRKMFKNMSVAALYWTPQQYSDKDVWATYASVRSNYFDRSSGGDKVQAFSIRCVKNY